VEDDDVDGVFRVLHLDVISFGVGSIHVCSRWWRRRRGGG
jgi:hypothetical protein